MTESRPTATVRYLRYHHLRHHAHIPLAANVPSRRAAPRCYNFLVNDVSTVTDWLDRQATRRFALTSGGSMVPAILICRGADLWINSDRYDPAFIAVDERDPD